MVTPYGIRTSGFYNDPKAHICWYLHACKHLAVWRMVRIIIRLQCPSPPFHIHLWIWTGVIVRKRWNRVKLAIFWSVCLAVCINSLPSVNSQMPELGQTLLWPVWPWPLTLASYMNITCVDGNYSWKLKGWYDERNIMKKMWQTNRKRTDREDRS